MKTRTSDSQASLHPVFIFATAYLVALCCSVAMCISLYNYFSHGDETNTSVAKGENVPVMTAGMISVE